MTNQKDAELRRKPPITTCGQLPPNGEPPNYAPLQEKGASLSTDPTEQSDKRSGSRSHGEVAFGRAESKGNE